jgi:hypothetical protein
MASASSFGLRCSLHGPLLRVLNACITSAYAAASMAPSRAFWKRLDLMRASPADAGEEYLPPRSLVGCGLGLGLASTGG